MSGLFYNCILRFTDDSLHIVRDMRTMLNNMNTPLVWLLWGIMALVYVDVINQFTGNPMKYTFTVGKVMFEALFYSLFFVIWGDLFKQSSWKQRFSVITQPIKIIRSLHINRNKTIFLLYVLFHNFIFLIYTTWTLYIIQTIISLGLYIYLLKKMCTYTVEDTQIYATPINNTGGESHDVDAIIKWEYSKAPPKTTNSWIILN